MISGFKDFTILKQVIGYNDNSMDELVLLHLEHSHLKKIVSCNAHFQNSIFHEKVNAIGKDLKELEIAFSSVKDQLHQAILKNESNQNQESVSLAYENIEIILSLNHGYHLRLMKISSEIIEIKLRLKKGNVGEVLNN